jgi:rSAM/selenodomain-associated transferase 2
MVHQLTGTTPPLKQLDLVICTLNDAPYLHNLLQHLHLSSFHQVIIADGGSKDHTRKVAQAMGAHVVECPQRGRAAQFNYAAKFCTAPYLLFLHADSIPGTDMHHALLQAINSHCVSASFKLGFDYKHWFLRANAWFTRFDTPFFRFGDQGLLVQRTVFNTIGGYDEDHLLLEDQEIFWRLRKHGPHRIMHAKLITSSRKYLKNGVYRLQAIFFALWFRYYTGTSQHKLLHLYKRWVMPETNNTPLHEKEGSSVAHIY